MVPRSKAAHNEERVGVYRCAVIAMRARWWLVGVWLVSIAGCATTHATETVASGAHARRSVLVGLVNKQQIFEADARWEPAYSSAVIDPEAARALAAAPVGARVDVFLGTWCGDSVREVGRFLRYLDSMGSAPFEVRLIAVDRTKSAPGFSEGVGLRYVPTFVVVRGGREVGRIIESPPNEIGRDLAALLSGAASGELSGRTL